MECLQPDPSSSVLFRVEKVNLLRKLGIPDSPGPTDSNPEVPMNVASMLMSCDTRRAQEMPVYLIYKDFTILPLRMHFSPNSCEEWKFKLTQTWPWGAINNPGHSVLEDLLRQPVPTLPVSQATRSTVWRRVNPQAGSLGGNPERDGTADPKLMT